MVFNVIAKRYERLLLSQSRILITLFLPHHILQIRDGVLRAGSSHNSNLNAYESREQNHWTTRKWNVHSTMWICVLEMRLLDMIHAWALVFVSLSHQYRLLPRTPAENSITIFAMESDLSKLNVTNIAANKIQQTTTCCLRYSKQTGSRCVRNYDAQLGANDFRSHSRECYQQPHSE